MTNTLTIKSRKTGETFEFWMPISGGYIRLESKGKDGTLGQQICMSGRFTGETLEAIPETFKSVCRRWYRAYMRKQKSYE